MVFILELLLNGIGKSTYVFMYLFNLLLPVFVNIYILLFRKNDMKYKHCHNKMLLALPRKLVFVHLKSYYIQKFNNTEVLAHHLILLTEMTFLNIQLPYFYSE